MLTEISFAGMLFSPLVLCIPVALLLTWLARRLMHRLSIHHPFWNQIFWNEAWLDISLFILFLVLTVSVTGRY